MGPLEPLPPDLDIPESWAQAVAGIRADAGLRSVLVIGGTAAGKTTFARLLHRELAEGSRAAFIDGDPGQSEIGPPGTVGLWMPEGEVHLRFVGSTSPQGHLLQTCIGMRRLLGRARERAAARVVLDSCGLVGGAYAREFQYHLIDLLQPDAIVAFRGEPSLELLLRNFRQRPRLHLLWLPLSPRAAAKPPADRRRHREERFRRYFREAASRELEYSRLGLLGWIPGTPSEWQGRLCALCGPDQFVRALGIAQAVDPDRRRVRILAPPFPPEQVTTLLLGSLRLAPTGEELGR